MLTCCSQSQGSMCVFMADGLESTGGRAGRLFFSFCVVCWLGWKMTNESFALRKGQTWPEFCGGGDGGGGGDGHGHRDAAADDDDEEEDDDEDDDDGR